MGAQGLAGCAAGLGALAIMGGAGLLEEQDPIALADRIQNERARVAVSQTAAEHQRAVFVARQEQFDRRAARTMYASATGVTPGR